MTQPDELKPCPFCGGSVVVKYAELHGYDKYVIRCCGVNILRATKEGVIKRWNTRTPDLSRIFTVAAHANAFLSPAGNSKKYSEMVDANEALTNEDRQLLEAVLKE